MAPPGAAIDLDDVRAAARRLDGVAHRTPVLHSRTLDRSTGATVLLKAECFQRCGAFKFRGAYNHIAALEPQERARGLVTYSSGNHAQALALAASLLGAACTVVVPADAPRTKLDAAAGYGAELVTYDPLTEDRVAVADELAASRGLHVVPPFDDPMVMAGQGTVALELLEDVGELDLLLVPVGGGGLISGCATAARGLGTVRTVLGVEPEGADDTRRSFRAGERVALEAVDTVADGLRALRPGALTFPVIQRLVDGIACVSEAAIVQAMAFCFERLKIVVEPSGAVALAALLSGEVPAAGLRVGVVLSGGNVAPETLASLIGRGGA